MDVSRKLNDKANIIISPCSPISNVKTLILSPTDVDHLRMIGDVGKEEEALFHKTVHEIWPGSTKKYEERDSEIPVKSGESIKICSSEFKTHFQDKKSYSLTCMEVLGDPGMPMKCCIQEI